MASAKKPQKKSLKSGGNGGSRAKKKSASSAGTKGLAANQAGVTDKPVGLAAGSQADNPQFDPEIAEKIARVRSQVRESFGNVAMAMMMLPRYRHQTLGDLQHLLLEPLIRDRIAIAYPASNSSVKGESVADEAQPRTPALNSAAPAERLAKGHSREHDQTRAPQTRDPQNDVTLSDVTGMAIWASVSEEVDAKIRDQIKSGTFPVRLKAQDWTSGNINWLLDIIAPDKKTTTSVIANFKQVVKEGNLRLHPIVTRLVDEDVLEKMGAEKMGGGKA